MPDPKELYGRGFRFPLVANSALGWISGAEAVAQAIRALLLTEPGERVGRADYGVGLRRFLFAPNNLTTRSRIRQRVADAVERFEARVNLDEVSVTADAASPTLLFIDVRYTLVGESTPQNLVFPFYLDGAAT